MNAWLGFESGRLDWAGTAHNATGTQENIVCISFDTLAAFVQHTSFSKLIKVVGPRVLGWHVIVMTRNEHIIRRWSRASLMDEMTWLGQGEQFLPAAHMS